MNRYFVINVKTYNWCCWLHCIRHVCIMDTILPASMNKKQHVVQNMAPDFIE